MLYDSLIDAEDLFDYIDDPDWVIIDCHFELDNPDSGLIAYQEGHIPGAVYAHLDHQLAGPVIPGKTGRHPLPDIEIFSETLSNWGIDDTVQVIVYDNRGGGIAARLWWMLKWLGHHPVALLDGGLASWTGKNLPLETSVPRPIPRFFEPSPRPDLVATLEDIENDVDHRFILVDSRAPERYRAEIEPIDPIAGHIPAAVNAFYMDNLDQYQKFLHKNVLIKRFSAILKGRKSLDAVFYCGSGVTSTHNILAMYHAGLGIGKLYPGSWSEWITDPKRPIEIQNSPRQT